MGRSDSRSRDSHRKEGWEGVAVLSLPALFLFSHGPQAVGWCCSDRVYLLNVLDLETPSQIGLESVA